MILTYMKCPQYMKSFLLLSESIVRADYLINMIIVILGQWILDGSHFTNSCNELANDFWKGITLKIDSIVMICL